MSKRTIALIVFVLFVLIAISVAVVHAAEETRTYTDFVQDIEKSDLSISEKKVIVDQNIEFAKQYFGAVNNIKKNTQAKQYNKEVVDYYFTKDFAIKTSTDAANEYFTWLVKENGVGSADIMVAKDSCMYKDGVLSNPPATIMINLKSSEYKGSKVVGLMEGGFEIDGIKLSGDGFDTFERTLQGFKVNGIEVLGGDAGSLQATKDGLVVNGIKLSGAKQVMFGEKVLIDGKYFSGVSEIKKLQNSKYDALYEITATAKDTSGANKNYVVGVPSGGKCDVGTYSMKVSKGVRIFGPDPAQDMLSSCPSIVSQQDDMSVATYKGTDETDIFEIKRGVAKDDSGNEFRANGNNNFLNIWYDRNAAKNTNFLSGFDGVGRVTIEKSIDDDIFDGAFDARYDTDREVISAVLSPVYDSSGHHTSSTAVFEDMDMAFQTAGKKEVKILNTDKETKWSSDKSQQTDNWVSFSKKGYENGETVTKLLVNDNAHLNLLTSLQNDDVELFLINDKLNADGTEKLTKDEMKDLDSKMNRIEYRNGAEYIKLGANAQPPKQKLMISGPIVDTILYTDGKGETINRDTFGKMSLSTCKSWTGWTNEGNPVTGDVIVDVTGYAGNKWSLNPLNRINRQQICKKTAHKPIPYREVTLPNGETYSRYGEKGERTYETAQSIKEAAWAITDKYKEQYPELESYSTYDDLRGKQVFSDIDRKSYQQLIAEHIKVQGYDAASKFPTVDNKALQELSDVQLITLQNMLSVTSADDYFKTDKRWLPVSTWRYVIDTQITSDKLHRTSMDSFHDDRATIKKTIFEAIDGKKNENWVKARMAGEIAEGDDEVWREVMSSIGSESDRQIAKKIEGENAEKTQLRPVVLNPKITAELKDLNSNAQEIVRGLYSQVGPTNMPLITKNLATIKSEAVENIKSAKVTQTGSVYFMLERATQLEDIAIVGANRFYVIPNGYKSQDKNAPVTAVKNNEGVFVYAEGKDKGKPVGLVSCFAYIPKYKQK